MADSAAAATSSDSAAQRAAEQARLRKERREAKIKAGGSARLNKITGLGGGRVVEGDAGREEMVMPATADPEEVDISQHLFTAAPVTTPSRVVGAVPSEQAVDEAQLRQMMLGLDRPGTDAAAGGGVEDDPLMKMMSQMMGGLPPGSSPFPGMPPMAGGMPFQQPQAARPDSYTVLFRLLHALLGLGLGLYVIVFTPFTGTRIERERAVVANASHLAASDDANELRKRAFLWFFATGEALLLTTRFFLDKGRRPPPGILWTVVGHLPEPLRGYVAVGLRYGQIFTTVRADILACIFVLGICSWWKS